MKLHKLTEAKYTGTGSWYAGLFRYGRATELIEILGEFPMPDDAIKAAAKHAADFVYEAAIDHMGGEVPDPNVIENELYQAFVNDAFPYPSRRDEQTILNIILDEDVHDILQYVADKQLTYIIKPHEQPTTDDFA